MPLQSSDLHGKWYTQAKNGRLFIGSNLVAGTVIPISTATAATSLILYNPAGSGVDVELASCSLSMLSATLVVSGIGLGYASGLTTTPTSTTALTPVNARLGGAASKVNLYSAATLAAAATYFMTMFTLTATSGQQVNSKYDFDGALILPPGSLVHVVGLVAQSQVANLNFVWAEIQSGS